MRFIDKIKTLLCRKGVLDHIPVWTRWGARGVEGTCTRCGYRGEYNRGKLVWNRANYINAASVSVLWFSSVPKRIGRNCRKAWSKPSRRPDLQLILASSVGAMGAVRAYLPISTFWCGSFWMKHPNLSGRNSLPGPKTTLKTSILVLLNWFVVSKPVEVLSTSRVVSIWWRVFLVRGRVAICLP